MLKRSFMAILCGVIAAVGLSAATTVTAASAAPSCANVEVLFARGTAEPAPPVGLTGLSFGQALRGALPGKSVVVRGVNYPASANFRDRIGLAQTVINGVKDTQNRITFLARTCPQTRIVVGGYSQGAVVAGYAVAPRVTLPAQYRGSAPAPLPASVARNVAAVVLFAPPSARFLRDAQAPAIEVGPLYQGKTIRYCIAGDTICNGAPLGQPNGLHVLYAVNGDTVNAAGRVAARI
ncbi:cutinase [Williamsia sp. Leaf354]|uniref:cutinase family protein n=1 Tax=Williamsia sp. Leaf354 TaxID=1736349 RepID=UPI0006FD6566|nr:cutinase family protein [Williamsia sp. Leaf354]KQR97328.1 cutinase [Williamsia sp. Leaf354]